MNKDETVVPTGMALSHLDGASGITASAAEPIYLN
jgi:hypothetical protein